MKKIICIFVFCMCTAVQAEPWHVYTKITHLYPTTTGYAFLVEAPLPERSLCDDGRRFSISLSHANYDAMVSSLLMAYAAEMSIRLNLVTGEAPTCSPSVDRFFVIKN
jgi:hypothetical protein